MRREDHQPREGEPIRPSRSAAEMRAVCGATAAFIIVDGASGANRQSNLAAAADAARGAGMPVVFALADDSIFEDAPSTVKAVEYDRAIIRERTREAGDFELFGIPYGLLAIMRDAAERDAAAGAAQPLDSIVIMDAAQDKITSDHLFELCQDARAHPDTDVVTSWIAWLRRTPLFVRIDFLEQLEHLPYAGAHGGAGTAVVATADADAAKDGAARNTAAHNAVPCVPRIRARDHVFGEEPLAAPPKRCKVAEAFLGACTMTALEALELARFARAHPDEELHSPNQALSLMGPIAPEPLNEADSELVEVARRVLDASADLPPAEAAELAWADAFGMRNRADFPLLCDRRHKGKLAYLDSAATTQRVDAAIQAQRDFDVHENANVYRGAYELSAQATFSLNDARARLEGFIGAKRRQTVLTANTTTALNLVAQAWGEHNIAAGDRIVCALADHHSNTLPFFMLAERKKAHVDFIPYDADGRIDQDAYAKALTRRPKLVCLAHIGNVFGIEAPVAQMTAQAHEAGARVLVDAAQSFPHVKIDVEGIGADWVAFSAHKAYGPLGIGGLWISPSAFDEMDPLGGGGGTVSHVATDSYYLRRQALQYEMGTPPISQAIGWAAAIEYLEGLGMEAVARQGAALTRHLVHGLARIDGVKVIGDHTRPDGQGGLVSFAMRGVAPADMAGFLGKLGVAIRAGGHCALPLHASLGLVGSGRVSIGVYTTRDDIDAALVALELCRRKWDA